MSNEVYIITGGARRIGYALTRFFSEQAKRVIISYRSEYPELAELR
ncbi:MAG: dihydromonapterin reductase, partial [Plesiomonas sp.]